MWYEMGWEHEIQKYVVWKVEGMKAEIVFQTESLTRAMRAEYLIDKYGHGALRYPNK